MFVPSFSLVSGFSKYVSEKTDITKQKNQTGLINRFIRFRPTSVQFINPDLQ